MNQVYFVHPSILTDQHLESELATITTAPNNFDSKDGNISFFRDKFHFLNLRCSILRMEYEARHGEPYPHIWKIKRKESPELWGRFEPNEQEVEDSFEDIMNTVPDNPLISNKPISGGNFRLRKIVIDHLRDGMKIRTGMLNGAWEYNGRLIKLKDARYVIGNKEDNEFLNKLVAGTGMSVFDLTDPECIGKLAMYFIG